MTRTLPIWLTLVVAIVAGQVPAAAQQFSAGQSVRIAAGETHQGDIYATGELIEVVGRLEGDLIAAGQRVQTTGPIDGDLFAAARTIDIRGPVADSVRLAGEQITVDAMIDGDLVAAGNRCRLFENARVTGGVTAACATLDILGAVGRDLRGAAGEVTIGGHVRGNAQIRADRLVLGPQARIDGDLDYQSRTPLSPEEAARVGGTVLFDEVVDDDASSGGRTGGLLFWLWQTAAALLAGILMVAVFRGLVPHLGAVLADNTTVGALLGFAAFLVVPAGSVVAMVTIVGLPVGIAVVLLFVVALYAAKLPVAAWVGGRLLALAGRPAASPYAAMALGIVALYLLIAIPYLGRLVWLVATWLGLGAMVLSGREYLQARRRA
jgi:cytoskeletal protein CcmA (bactofilin family)